MRLAQTLWLENADLAQAALAHPFVAGLGDGALPLAAFQRYVGQDAFFLDAFGRAYALALAHASDPAAATDFANLLAGVREELRLHAGYAERWSVELTHVEPAEATLHYTDFLLATAALSSVGETCAAMAPCMRLYAWLGQTLAARGTSASNPYAEWITTYASPAFESLAARLEALLDRYGSDTSSVRRAYRRAMKLELAFFEAV